MSVTQSGNHLFAFANSTSIGTTTLVAAVAGFSIVVEQMLVFAPAANTVQFISSAGATAISPPWQLNNSVALSYNGQKDCPLMSTANGSSLQFTTSAATSATVMITYRLVAE